MMSLFSRVPSSNGGIGQINDACHPCGVAEMVPAFSAMDKTRLFLGRLQTVVACVKCTFKLPPQYSAIVESAAHPAGNDDRHRSFPFDIGGTLKEFSAAEIYELLRQEYMMLMKHYK